MGANTALFSIVDATTFHPVPGVGEPDRVVELLTTVRGREQAEWASPDLEDLCSAETPIEVVAGLKMREGTLAVANVVQRVRVMYTSSGYFPALGVRLARGRPFRPQEDAGPGQHPVAILSHELWQSRLGGRADVLSTVVTLNRVSYQVVGVAPASFRHHRMGKPAPDLWVPLTQHPVIAGSGEWATDRKAFWVEALGRLRPGATVQEANAALATVAARLAREFPESNRERGAIAVSFGPVRAMNRVETTVAITAVLAGGALVLFIICTNLAGLMLARGATRRRELAVRAAMGAGRARLARAVLVEAAVLAAGGAVIGSAAAWAGIRLVAATGLLGPLDADLPLDLPVLAFSGLLVLTTALAVGMVPAVRLTRPKAIGSLREEIGGGGCCAGRFHRVAVSAQVGVAVLFVAVSALFARSLSQLDGRDLGFNPRRLLVVSLDLTAEGYDAARGNAFTDRVREVVAALPDVASAAIADGLPIDLVGNFTSASRSDASHAEADGVRVEFTAVGPGFFEVVGTPVLRGRGIEPTDTAGSPHVVVITKGLADRLWPGESALGRQVRLLFGKGDGTLHTVVGVTPDVASSRPTENWPQVFVPLTQHPDRMRLRLLVRARSDAAALAKPVQTVVQSIDPLFAVPPAVTSAELVASSLEDQRATATAAGGMGLAGLLLSMFGVYGLVTFVVSQRTREFGLRMALGASRGRVLRTVLRDVGLLAAPGLVVGLLAACGLAAAVRSMLLGVGPLNPRALGLTVLLVLAVVLVASVGPAARAARVDPSVALRAE
jgi:predicted permease